MFKTLPDCFCLVCGFNVGNKHTLHKIRKGSQALEAYMLYFELNIGDQNKSWLIIQHVAAVVLMLNCG